MQPEDQFINLVKVIIEAHLKWGKSETWATQDYQALSEKIGEKTGVHLSTVTLKRLWGRVKYTSNPSLATLDALAQFIDYENWRDFKTKQTGTIEAPNEATTVLHPTISSPTNKKQPRKSKYFSGFGLLIIGVLIYATYSFLSKAPTVSFEEYRFSSKKVVGEGVPNSVIFDVDARKARFDSVIIQQTWDSRRRVSIPKSQQQYTAIYYYPGNFTAKLVIGNKVVKEHSLLIQSGGWLPLIEQDPMPVYLKKEDVITGGKMGLSFEQAMEKSGNPKSNPSNIYFYNTRDYGAIYTDDFVFETALRNEYKEGAGICQKTSIMLQCVDNIVLIPLSAKGCVSDLQLAFTRYYSSGKKEDLSAFGVDFSDYVKLRIESGRGKAQLFLNDKLAYTIKNRIDKSKIVGISFCFQGAGSVDYVKLFNEKVKFEDGFKE